MTDQQFEDLAIVAGTVISQAIFVSAGIYLVVTEHYGWAWIPFLISALAGFKRSTTSSEEGA